MNAHDEEFEVAGVQDAIWDAADPMQLMDRVVAQALELIENADAAVVELAVGDGYLTYVCAGGRLAHDVGLRQRLDGSLSGRAMQSGRTLRCDDTEADGRVNRVACRRLRIASMVCVPLVKDHRSLGALTVSSAQPGVFSEADVRMLTPLAEFITTVISAASELRSVTSRLFDAQRPSSYREGAAAEFVANVMRPGIVADVEARQRIARTIDQRLFSIVCQPIVALDTGRLVGVEALARFSEEPTRTPDLWFAEAHRYGRGVELEHAAVHAALDLLDRIPESVYLAVNVGPEAIIDTRIVEPLARHARRVVVEITEHVRVRDYEAVRAAVAAVRTAGVRLAIDDTGSGFSSLSHILELTPDIIKLDRDLTTVIDADPVRRALTASLVTFAREADATIVAEGIETSEQLDILVDLGVGHGQGYHIARPAPIEQLEQSFPGVRSRVSS